MTKDLLKQIMMKPAQRPEIINTKELIEKINAGYVVKRVDKYQTKKTFAPSTLVWNHGECARYWYLAFEGNTFESSDTPYAVANMTSGTDSHNRIQKAMLDAEMVVVYYDDDNNPTTEFKVTSSNPPIFGYGDAMINWNGEEIVGEIKTMNSDSFEYLRAKGKPRASHMMQLLIYMKILNKSKGVMLYENKNTHELFAFPVEVNETYKAWIDNTFSWLQKVRKAWVDKTLPEKNYRSNSKICKLCPLKTACDNSEKGVIKIKAMEKLSEIV
jgi:CRISPR/Cas system-associated exonuclease Cas4 (RecB family)